MRRSQEDNGITRLQIYLVLVNNLINLTLKVDSAENETIHATATFNGKSQQTKTIQNQSRNPIA